jgi:thiol:disulfide interchange protein
MERRKFIALPVLSALPLWAILTHTSATAAGRELPTSKSLQSDLAAALKTSKPLVVLVSLDNCPFCKIARENYLLPLSREQSLKVVQVNLGYNTAIVDAAGNQTTQAELIKSWQIISAPTVLFLGKNGQEIAPRLVGGTTSDFYGAYLQERIDKAMLSFKD